MKTLLVIVSIVLTVILTTSCSRVGTGELGLVFGLNKQIMPNPVVNDWEVTFLDSMTIVDSSQIRLQIENVSAKDIDGILFRDIDAQVTFDLNPAGAVNYYKQTTDITRLPDGTICLGCAVVSKEAKNALIKTFTVFKAGQVQSDKKSMEDKLKELLMIELHARYPDGFNIRDVNIDSAQLDANVEKVLQAQALIDSEKRTIESRTELQTKLSALLNQELTEMKNTAREVGISVSELMKYKNDKERNKVLSEMARNNSNTQVQIKE